MANGDYPFYESIRAVLELPVADKERKARLKKLGVENTLLNAIHLELSEKAASGDVQAAKYLRDTAMVKPQEMADADADAEGLDLSGMTDEELRSIAARAAKDQ